jgi:hypothetical protein
MAEATVFFATLLFQFCFSLAAAQMERGVVDFQNQFHSSAQYVTKLWHGRKKTWPSHLGLL